MASAALKHRPTYAGKVALRRAIEAAKAGGLDVGGFEVAPDGTIRIFEKAAMPTQPTSIFDQLEAEGKI